MIWIKKLLYESKMSRNTFKCRTYLKLMELHEEKSKLYDFKLKEAIKGLTFNEFLWFGRHSGYLDKNQVLYNKQKGGVKK